jgi:hypothetical protein
MSTALTKKQTAGRTPGSLRRGVIWLGLWALSLIFWAIAAGIFEEGGTTQPGWKKMIAFALVLIGADIWDYRKRKAR